MWIACELNILSKQASVSSLSEHDMRLTLRNTCVSYAWLSISMNKHDTFIIHQMMFVYFSRLCGSYQGINFYFRITTWGKSIWRIYDPYCFMNFRYWFFCGWFLYNNNSLLWGYYGMPLWNRIFLGIRNDDPYWK